MTYAGIEPAIFRSVGGRLAIGPAGRSYSKCRVLAICTKAICVANENAKQRFFHITLIRNKLGVIEA